MVLKYFQAVLKLKGKVKPEVVLVSTRFTKGAQRKVMLGLSNTRNIDTFIIRSVSKAGVVKLFNNELRAAKRKKRYTLQTLPKTQKNPIESRLLPSLTKKFTLKKFKATKAVKKVTITG